MSKKYLVLLVLSVLSVITFLDRNAISLAGQRISVELGLTERDFGWILTAFTISYGLFEIPTGRLGDRLGPRSILARVVLWWSFFTALTGFAGGFMSLFVIRFLFGAGEAGAYPNTAIAIRHWFDKDTRGFAQAAIWGASRIGGFLAPFIVVPLQVAYGWRISFYVLGAIGVIWVVFWLWWYDQPTSQVAGNLRPVNWGKWLRGRQFWIFMIMYYCYASGVFFFISWLPKYLLNGRGMDEQQMMFSASLPFLLGAFGCFFGGMLSDWLVRRYGQLVGRRIVPLVGLVVAGVCMLWGALTPSNSQAVAALTMGMLFMDFTAPVAWAVAIDIGGRDSGVMTGAMNTAGLLGGTVASLGIGYLIDWYGSYNFPVILVGALLIVGGLLWLLINPIGEPESEN